MVVLNYINFQFCLLAGNYNVTVTADGVMTQNVTISNPEAISSSISSIVICFGSIVYTDKRNGFRSGGSWINVWNGDNNLQHYHIFRFCCPVQLGHKPETVLYSQSYPNLSNQEFMFHYDCFMVVSLENLIFLNLL